MKNLFLSLFIVSSLVTLAHSSERPSKDSGNMNVNWNKTVKVYITGEVVNPKSIEIPENLGLISVVSSVGGPTSFGSMKRVTVFRQGKAIEYDRTKHPDKVIKLKHGDIIIVPEMSLKEVIK